MKYAIYAILCQKLKIILITQKDADARGLVMTRNTFDFKEKRRLIGEVQEVGGMLLDQGINARFIKSKCITLEDMSSRDLCAEIIKEAKRCTTQGIKCKFVCNAASLRLATNTYNFRERRRNL